MSQNEKIDISVKQIEEDIQKLDEFTILQDEIYAKIFYPNPSEIEKVQLKNCLFNRATVLKREKKLFNVQQVKDKYKATEMLDGIYRQERKIAEQEKQRALFRLSLPCWIDEDGKIDEVAFCDSFAEHDGFGQYKFKCVNGKMYTRLGLVDDRQLLQDIQNIIGDFVKSNIFKTAEKLLNAVKTCCYCPMPQPNSNLIHLKNGVYDIANRQFTSRWDFSLTRLDVDFEENYNTPKKWLKFLSELLNESDIATLQEYMGYCLIPTKKAQKALYIHGKGGEGKSVIKEVLHDILGSCMVTTGLHELVESKFSLATLEGKLLALDDDAELSALKETGKLKSLVTDMDKIQVNPKGLPAYETVIYTRLIALSNAPIKALYDQTEGNFRRQIIISTKPKQEDRKDDPFLGDKLKKEKSDILRWCIDGLHRLIDNDYSFTISEQAKGNLDNLKKESFNVLSYVEDSDYIAFGDKSKDASSVEIYNGYTLWCNENAETPVKQRTLINYFKNNQESLGVGYRNNITRGNKHIRGFIALNILRKYDKCL